MVWVDVFKWIFVNDIGSVVDDKIIDKEWWLDFVCCGGLGIGKVLIKVCFYFV